MNRWLLGSGAIATSAVALYGWTHPATFSWLNTRWQQATQPPPSEIEAVYDRMLNQAQQIASDDKLAEAIQTLVAIPKNSRYYGKARQLCADWSQELLQRASSQYQQANVDMALWMLSAIPSHSQYHDRVVELRDRWRQENGLYRQALLAKSQGNWNSVMAAVKSLRGSSLYNSLPVQALMQQATANLINQNRNLSQIAAAPIAPSAVRMPVLPSVSSAQSAPVPATAPPVVSRQQALSWAEPQSDNPGNPEYISMDWAVPALAAPPAPAAVTPPAPSPVSQPPAIVTPLSDNPRPTSKPTAAPIVQMGVLPPAANPSLIPIATPPIAQTGEVVPSPTSSNLPPI